MFPATVHAIRLLSVVALGGLSGCTELSTGPNSTVPAMRVELAAQRYEDPNGYFTIIPPAGCRVETYPNDPRGKVAFHLDGNTDLRVLVTPVDYSSFDTMLAELRQKQRELRGRVDMGLEVTELDGRMAVKKTLELQGTKLVAYDFMVGKVHHDLQFASARRDFGKYLPLVMVSIQTYEPIQRDVPPEAAKQAAIAKRVRLGRLFLDQGNIEAARQVIAEGLEMDPVNIELVPLRERLDAK
ncbi:MAG: hypothetical protein ACOC7K_00085 [bacterium]